MIKKDTIQDKKRQFFIYGYYGYKNAGDDAMLYALLNEINKHFPNDVFVVCSATESIEIPLEMRKKVKIVKPKIPTFLFELKRSSFFIVGGGTFIFDYSKSKLINISNLLIYYLRILLFAKMCCKKIIFLSIGVGDISTRLGRYIGKKIYETTDYITVRDSLSLQLLNEMHIKNKVKLSFDLAAFLPTFSSKTKFQHDGKIIGVSILPFYLFFRDNNKNDIIMVDNIAKSLEIWLGENTKNTVYLFPLQGKQERSSRNDEDITKLLYERLKHPGRVKLFSYHPDPRRIISEMEKCDAILGMRYHASLFACLTKKPLIMIDYSIKCTALAKDFQIPKNATISPNEILEGKLDIYIKNLLKNPEDFLSKIPAELLQKRNFLFDEEMLEALS